MALRIVTATRASMAEFEARSALCRSLRRASAWSAIELNVASDNTLGLAHHYNQAIASAAAGDVLVFVHDDVWVDDWLIAQRLEDALGAFDVVGVAGNTRRTPRQQSWILRGDTDIHDSGFLSGSVAHGDSPAGASVLRYGPAPAAVQLLDGVLLAARAATLHKSEVRFDPAFDFHFYDTDFCRSCSAAGLRLGTWPIALTHASAGRYGHAQWKLAYQRYLQKWGE